jgi:hypothetical protein
MKWRSLGNDGEKLPIASPLSRKQRGRGAGGEGFARGATPFCS